MFSANEKQLVAQHLMKLIILAIATKLKMQFDLMLELQLMSYE